MTGRGWCLSVPHSARGARLARHRMMAALTGTVTTEVLVDAAAVAAELVGNAVRHASPLLGGTIHVAWTSIDRNGVEIRVTDGGSSVAPEVQQANPDSVDGRGLTIVAALASSWGVECDEGCQCVWAKVYGAG
ncbi:MAG: ATP-binding protein [Dactylosporangium sp.]|nr:ATP-binding protein [Dactylosporangium sp.]NNJ59638.1 ATP-binding protein [Dactylosporangium sp.]